MSSTLVSLALTLLLGFACWRAAQWKGRKPLLWVALTVFFGPLPLVVLLVVPRSKRSFVAAD